MASVLKLFIVQDRECWHSRKVHEAFSQTGWYLQGIPENALTAQDLPKEAWQSFPETALSEQAREAFLNDYQELIDQLTAANGSRLEWWATFTANKIRTGSPLPGWLALARKALQALEKASRSERSLIFFDFPWPLVLALQLHAQAQGWQVAIIASSGALLRFRLASLVEAAQHLGRSVLSAFAKVHRLRRLYGGPPTLDPQSPVYLLKSFLYKHSVNAEGQYRDAFFGDLLPFLQTQLGKRSQVLVSVLVHGDHEAACSRLSGLTSPTVVPLEIYLSYFDILKALSTWLQQRWLKRWIVPQPLLFGPLDLSPMLQEMGKSHLEGFQFFQYLHYWMAKRLLRTVQIHTFLLTFEANPWERMMIAAIRQEAPQTKILGYQHTVVPQAAVQVFTGITEVSLGPLPDQIFTTGLVPAEILRKYSALSPERIQPACALRFDYLHRMQPFERPTPAQKRHILVALDGLPEVSATVDYALKQALQLPEVQFCFRTHPVLPFEQILKLCQWSGKLPPNVEVSENRALTEDIQRAHAVLYWGSTVSLESLMLGRPVIHFDREDLLSFDPLFELTAFKWKVNRRIALEPILQTIWELPQDTYTSLWQRARRYLQDYFYPISPEAMSLFLFPHAELTSSQASQKSGDFA